MLCIFCLEEKPARTGAGEHPIPVALGGSWTIDRVCMDCDNTFGHTFDAQLAEVTRIADRREALQLAGQSGKVPNALSEVLSRPVSVVGAPHHRLKVRQLPDGSFEKKTIPNIDFNISIVDGQCTAAIRPDTFVLGMMPPEETRNFIGRRLKAALKARELSTSDEIIAITAEKMFAGIELVEVPITVQLTRKIVTGGYAASLLKVAYEASWYWLGDAWLSDAEAERIRNHLMGDESAAPKGFMQDGELRPLNLYPTNREHAHIIYLFQREGGLAVEVQLFDLNGLGVFITSTPEKYCIPKTSAIIMDTVAGTYREVPSKGLFQVI